MNQDRVRNGVLAALVGAGLMAWVCVATAGFKYTGGVSVTSAWATGAAGTARNSSNGVEYVYCTVTGTTASVSAQCNARNAAGTSTYCTTTNPNLVEAVKKMSSDSYIQFNFDSSHACQSIQVYSGSDYAPKIN